MTKLMISLCVALFLLLFGPLVVGVAVGSDWGHPSIPRAAELAWQAGIAALLFTILSLVPGVLQNAATVRSRLRAIASDVTMIVERALMYVDQIEQNLISRSCLQPAHEWSRLPELCATVGDSNLEYKLLRFYERVWRAEACLARTFTAIFEKEEAEQGREAMKRTIAIGDAAKEQCAKDGSLPAGVTQGDAAREALNRRAIELHAQAIARSEAAMSAKGAGLAFLFGEKKEDDIVELGKDIVDRIRILLREKASWSFTHRMSTARDKFFEGWLAQRASGDTGRKNPAAGRATGDD